MKLKCRLKPRTSIIKIYKIKSYLDRPNKYKKYNKHNNNNNNNINNNNNNNNNNNTNTNLNYPLSQKILIINMQYNKRSNQNQ